MIATFEALTFSDADLSYCLIEKDSLKNAKLSKKTILPNGLSYAACNEDISRGFQFKNDKVLKNNLQPIFSNPKIPIARETNEKYLNLFHNHLLIGNRGEDSLINTFKNLFKQLVNDLNIQLSKK